MQITITFKGHDITLPIATGETVQGLIYRALGSDYHFSTYVHNCGESFEGRNFKLFSFSELKGKYEIRDKNIVYPSIVKLEIRSVQAYFIQLLMAFFTVNHTVRFGANTVEIADVKLSNTTVYSNKVLIRTSSPMVAYLTEPNGFTKYFSPEEEDFYRLVNSNAARKWASYHGNSLDFQIKLTPVKNEKFIKRATRFKDTFINGWHGNFVLEAKPEIINFLYNTGLGSKNSQGFGMFDILSEDV